MPAIISMPLRIGHRFGITNTPIGIFLDPALPSLPLPRPLIGAFVFDRPGIPGLPAPMSRLCHPPLHATDCFTMAYLPTQDACCFGATNTWGCGQRPVAIETAMNEARYAVFHRLPRKIHRVSADFAGPQSASMPPLLTWTTHRSVIQQEPQQGWLVMFSPARLGRAYLILQISPAGHMLVTSSRQREIASSVAPTNYVD
ncbi:hypothetical protein FALBO_7993 [Fusarium albosuccineum]|uniref:Uncharacterized protein n=1 Tax=Fusarium albosuccineum TaxID=1237068 RepID=A0A8H4L947_9HYPO|nr:hypothetical protein FALBO_7993 [Fusarium albosuccineum]